MSKAKTKKFMDALSDASSDEDASDASGSDSDDEGGPADPEIDAPPTKKAKKTISVATLKKHGYRQGPSVKGLKAPDADSDYNFAWGTGNQQKEEEEEETPEERAATMKAATVGVAATAAYSQKVLERAQAEKDKANAAKEARAKKKALSVKDKEKRKRDIGQQSSAKNYVEEEKRIAREFGCYSGFD